MAVTQATTITTDVEPSPLGWPPTEPARGFDQWPSYTGFGDPSGDDLTDAGGAVFSGANQTIEGYKNFIPGTPSQPLTGTTVIRGCLFDNVGTNAPGFAPAVDGDLLVEYCTVRPTGKTDHTVSVDQVDGYQYGVLHDGTVGSPGTWNTFISGSATYRNMHLWGFSNGSKQTGSTQSNPIQWWDSVLESPRLNNDPGFDDHTDGIGAPSGGTNYYFEIHNTWIRGEFADTNALAFQNTFGGDYDNMTIDSCVFGGFGWMLAILEGTYPAVLSPDNLTFTNNVWYCGYPPQLGPLYAAEMYQGPGLVWSGNKVWVPAGSTFGDHATQDGLFWIPNASAVSGSGAAALAPFVSATDYGG